MKKLILLMLACGMFAGAYSQSNPLEPCCSIIKKNSKNIVVARDNTTGRLYQFRYEVKDNNIVKVNAPVALTAGKITAVDNVTTNYITVRPDYGEPCCAVVKVQPDPAEPCCGIVTYQNNKNGSQFTFQAPKNITNNVKKGDPVYAEPINDFNLTGPVSIKSRIHGAEPCCAIINVQPDPAEPCCNIVTYKNNITGAVSSINVNKKFASINIGDPIYAEPISGMGIIQSAYGNNGQMASYGYPATSADETAPANAAEKWVVKKVNAKSGTGKLYVSLPEDTQFDVTIYPSGSEKVLSNNMLKTSFSLLPGNYDLEINHIMITGVPVEKGNETRLKAGVLEITNEGNWTLYDETKKTVIVNKSSPQKRGLPIGKYKLTIMGQDTDIEIKDGETVVY